ncbi:hypothetical protein AG1IA_00289 [Rhizoctonia solani AG-1 IA]|uniref:Uncharacterized protein n=1 Tax=Thanatephorus cucumeris (strain AG1-IA) TaxID=983506 RepID=L8X662_THACA|nr:hypothetical protein AG1IA_00289 [Rhizoctonia solani AG-1 IA]
MRYSSRPIFTYAMFGLDFRRMAKYEALLIMDVRGIKDKIISLQTPRRSPYFLAIRMSQVLYLYQLGNVLFLGLLRTGKGSNQARRVASHMSAFLFKRADRLSPSSRVMTRHGHFYVATWRHVTPAPDQMSVCRHIPYITNSYICCDCLTRNDSGWQLLKQIYDRLMLAYTYSDGGNTPFLTPKCNQSSLFDEQ